MRRLIVHGTQLALTAGDFVLLKTLMMRAGRVVT